MASQLKYDYEIEYHGIQIKCNQSQLIMFDEAREEQFIQFLKANNFPYNAQFLQIGDLVLSQDHCIELKREEDIVQSLFDDRIHEQVKRMSENYKWYAVIIQCSRNVLNDHFTQQTFESLIDTLSIRMGAHIYLSNSNENTLEIICKIWRSVLKGPKEVLPINKTPRPSKNADFENRVYFLSGLLGTGYELAVRLLQYYKTPSSVIKMIGYTLLGKTAGGKDKLFNKPPVKGIGVKFIKQNKKMLFGNLENPIQNKETDFFSD